MLIGCGANGMITLAAEQYQQPSLRLQLKRVVHQEALTERSLRL